MCFVTMTNMASKYQKYYQDMIDSNKELFDQFKVIHDKYSSDPEKNKNEFNAIGSQVMKVIRSYETHLTSEMNSSSYSRFATGLSDKLWSVVRKAYPMIDFVGVK